MTHLQVAVQPKSHILVCSFLGLLQNLVLSSLLLDSGLLLDNFLLDNFQLDNFLLSNLLLLGILLQQQQSKVTRSRQDVQSAW